MVWSRSFGRSVREERFSRSTLFSGNTREPLQRVRVDDSEIKACFCAVIEEDEADDFANNGGESERPIRSVDNGFDVRDLLFDETD